MWQSSWTPVCNLEKENSYELLRIQKRIFWANCNSFENHRQINQWKTYFRQPKHRHLVGCIFYVLHVRDPWLFFICIHQILFDRSYILKMHICNIRLLLPCLNTVPGQNSWRSRAPPSMPTWVSNRTTLFNNWSSLLVLFVSISMSAFFISLFFPLWCDYFVFRPSANTEFLECLM